MRVYLFAYVWFFIKQKYKKVPFTVMVSMVYSYAFQHSRKLFFPINSAPWILQILVNLKVLLRALQSCPVFYLLLEHSALSTA